MASAQDARYRLTLAEGFLAEAKEDLALKRWRSCVDNSQLAVENAAKSVLATLGPIARTHAPGELLRQAVTAGRFAAEQLSSVARLADIATQLGWDVHVASDYGDENAHRTPWEMFDRDAAELALDLAKAAVHEAHQIASP